MSFCPIRRSSGQFNSVLQSFVQGAGLPLCDALGEDLIERVAQEESAFFGTGPGDIYSTALVLWAFVTQGISKDKSCAAAVARILAALVASGREPCSSQSGAYCKARQKLSERFLRRLTVTVAQGVEDAAPEGWRWQGRRALLVDGTTVNAPDTPANQKAYPQSRSQKPGLGFPLIRVVVLLTLATATLIDAAFGPCEGKESGETALLRTLFDSLRSQDVVVADSYYCSYWLAAMLRAKGADGVFRLHHMRPKRFRRGRDDQEVVWHRPQRHTWMDKATYATMPKSLTLREVRAQIREPGFRVRELVVVTTLTDAQSYPKDAILDLFHDRWQVELDLRAIKRSLQMEMLAMLRKEIWAHLLAYNLVRKVMAQAAMEAQLNPRQISFMGTVQTLNAFRDPLLGATANELPRLAKIIFVAVARHRVGDRPNRCEPRAIKRRPIQYARLKKPRAELRAALLAGAA
jgi:putative transposase